MIYEVRTPGVGTADFRTRKSAQRFARMIEKTYRKKSTVRKKATRHSKSR
jgi:hypothetical protein